jgi:hypothetical protein
MEKKIGLENPDFVKESTMRWSCRPLDMIVIEYFGDGDPAFGGSADDRPLGKAGNILNRPYRGEDVAVFPSVEEAHQAALKIGNRRPSSLLGVAPRWR